MTKQEFIKWQKEYVYCESDVIERPLTVVKPYLGSKKSEDKGVKNERR